MKNKFNIPVLTENDSYFYNLNYIDHFQFPEFIKFCMHTQFKKFYRRCINHNRFGILLIMRNK
jgi:hypothetical protein